MTKGRHSSSRRQMARPAGIAEYLWSCVLDDYLSEEEDNEFSRIIGKPDDTTSFFCGQTNNSAVEDVEDPRSIKIRGGSVSSIIVGTTDGSPGVWSNDAPDVAPMVWLALPEDLPDDASELSQPVSRAHADTSEPVIRNAQAMQFGNQRTRSKSSRDEGPEPRLSSARSVAGSRARSVAGSRASSFAKPISGSFNGSRGKSRNGSKITRSPRKAQPERKPRSRSIGRVPSEQRQPSNSRNGSRRSRSSSKIRSKNTLNNGSRARVVPLGGVGQRSTKSTGSRQPPRPLTNERAGRSTMQRSLEDKSMKSSTRRSVSRDSRRLRSKKR